MRSKKLVCAWIVAAVSVAASADAAITYPNLPNGTYRIAFVTAGGYQSYNTTTPTQTRSLSFWNSAVATEVSNSANAAFKQVANTWRPLIQLYDGSTTTSAYSIAKVDPAALSGVDTLPIYNTNGQLIANNAADLWDGTLAAPIGYDQNGNALTGAFWTGFPSTGALSNRPIGGTNTYYGTAQSTTSTWAQTSTLGGTNFLRFAAISDGFKATIPEPTSIALIAGLVAPLMRRRRA